MNDLLHARGDLVLIAAGIGPEVRGWLFGIDGPATESPVVEELDYLNTSGIVAVDNRVYRVLSSPSESNASGDLLVYDKTGVLAYRRVDGLADAHGLVWDGQGLIVPCSFTNEIFWLTPHGETSKVWRAPGEGDAWHINGVHHRDGQLYASAFGKFASHRGWAKNMGEPTGIIFDVTTQTPVVSGLACPHDPIAMSGGWLVCDSYTRRLLFIDDASGDVTRYAELGGWTRGVAISDEHIFVGVSGDRHGSDAEQRARVKVLDRADWRIVGEISLPCAEISSMALVPRAFLTSLRKGFRTNDLRVSVQDRRDLFERAGQTAQALKTTPMTPLERPQDFRVRIWVKGPRRVKAGEYFEVQIAIKNRSRRTLFTAAPFPVNIGIVFDEVGASSDQAAVRREPLPEPLAPGATRRFTLSVQSPTKPGTYRVRYTLVQEWVRWFDTDQRRLARLLSSNRRYVQLRVE